MADTLEDATTSLQEILAKVTLTSTADDLLAIRDELNAFNRALSFGPEFAALRRAADQSFNELGRQVTKSVLDGFRDRSAELATHVQEITAVKTEAGADAQQLRLEMVKRVVAATTAASDAFTAIKQAIKANDLPAAADKIDAALSEVRKIRNEFTQGA